MKLRIVSDGTTFGTKVLDEMDEPIERVTKVTWSIEANGPPGSNTGLARCTLELAGVPVTLEGDTEPPSVPEPD